jgi:hypothetical protein
MTGWVHDGGLRGLREGWEGRSGDRCCLWKLHRTTGLWVAAGFTGQSVCMRKGIAQQQAAAWQAQLQAAGEWRRESGSGGGGDAAAGFSAPPCSGGGHPNRLQTVYMTYRVPFSWAPSRLANPQSRVVLLNLEHCRPLPPPPRLLCLISMSAASQTWLPSAVWAPSPPCKPNNPGGAGWACSLPPWGAHQLKELTAARQAAPKADNRQLWRPLRQPHSPAITWPICLAVPSSYSLCVKRGPESIWTREKSGQRSEPGPSGPPRRGGRAAGRWRAAGGCGTLLTRTCAASPQPCCHFSGQMDLPAFHKLQA